MDKVIRDGMVAVLVSGGYGAGWSTWEDVNVFDPHIVEAIEAEKSKEEIVALAEKLYPEQYHGGAEQLSIYWLPVGTLFRINEYDGAESLETLEHSNWICA